MAGLLNDPLMLSLLVMGGVVGHLALLLLARFINPVMMLAGAFLILAMVSAMLIPGVEFFKWVRVYVAGITVLIGVFGYRAFRLSGPALAMFLWLVFYTLAGLWSDAPRSAVLFKGLIFPTFLTGALLALVVRSEDEFIKAMRVLVVFSTVFAIPCLLQLLFNPGSFNRIGRFDPWGISPNKMGGDGAAMLIFATVVALFDKNIVWKILAYACGTMLAVCILYTGSRAGAGQAAVAALIMGLPMFKRPILPLFLGAISAAVLVAIMPSQGPTAYERLGDVGFENRAGEWGAAMDFFRDSPIIGQGWVFIEAMRGEPTTRNMHSIYFQILSETGLLGVALFAIVVLMALWYAFQLVVLARRGLANTRLCFAAIAIWVAPLLHGLAEAASITGASINLLMIGFGLTMMTRLREFALQRQNDGFEEELPEYDPSVAVDYARADAAPAR